MRNAWQLARRIALAVLLSACTNETAAPVADSAQIIDRAIAAHGGERLADMSTIVSEWLLHDSLIFESRRPAPPWDNVSRWQAFALDFDSRRYADARYDGGSGYEWITGTVVNDSAAYRLDYRNRTYTRSAPEFDDAIADAMLLSPPVLLRWLTEHRELAGFAGQRRQDGADVQVLKLLRGDGSEVDVSIEIDSGRIHGVTSGYTDYDGSHVPLHFRYADWREARGLYFPARAEVTAHGYLARTAVLEHIAFGEPIAAYLEIPEGFIETASEAENVRDFRLEEIAAGVYFVGNGVMYQLIVEFDDFLVALDGSSGNVAHRIDAIREHIPDKPFRYVLASHHHNDHLHGLDEFAGLGSTILAAPAHASTIADYVQDELGRRPAIVTVADDYLIENGGRELRVMDLGPTPHSEHILAAYLPAEKILFTADLFVLGGRRTPVKPAMANGIALLQRISENNLDVERIVDPHSPLIATMADLRQSVDELREGRAGFAHHVRADLAAWRSAEGHVHRSLITAAREADAAAGVDGPLESILVTGITGRQGGAVARELLHRGYSVRGLTRNPDSPRARALTELGVQLLRGNFDDAASLDAALDGAHGVFAVTDFWEHGYEQEIRHGRNLVDAAARAGTSFVVFSSVASADQATNIPHFDSKWEIEKYLRKSGLNHAVVRPVSFMENWQLDSDDVVAGRIVTAGSPQRLHQYISVRDIARFVADAFDAPARWNGVALDIAADEISLQGICELLTEITGHTVAPELISWAEYESLAGEEMATMSRWFDSVGYRADIAALRRAQPDMLTLEDYLRRLL